MSFRRLLSNTAGLDTHGIGTTPQYVFIDFDDIILGSSIWHYPNGVNSIYPPGEVYDYSGGGFTVAEHMLELVTGQSYTDFATEHVFKWPIWGKVF